MFKIIEDLKPEYLVVSFDLKAPTARHKLYEGYKATRKGMPDELAQQMPIIKKILRAMNILIIEKEGYEADDVLGTLSRIGEKNNLEVVILSGDRDTFQLVTKNVTVRIPRTKAGKTETEDFTQEKVFETYGLNPVQLIEVKALQGDSSDNIPGVPGVGEKTALTLIQKYETVENLYNKLEIEQTDLKGKLKENLINNKELAILSRTLGTINLEVPIDEKLEDMKIEEWNKEEIIKIFEELKFNRFIERFDLKRENKKTDEKNKFEIEEVKITQQVNNLINTINDMKKLIYSLEIEEDNNEELIVKKKIKSIYIYIEKENKVYYLDNIYLLDLKDIFENINIKKYGFKLKDDIILLYQNGIRLNGIEFDLEVAEYLINSTTNKYTVEEATQNYINFNINDYLEKLGENTTNNNQMTLFDSNTKENTINYRNIAYAYGIGKIYNILLKKLEETQQLKLFNEIEIPLIDVLADMQIQGIYVDKKELLLFGEELKSQIDILTKQIYELSGEEFNINSPKQLGEVLFEKLKLTYSKKTKSGYSTDVDTLEKIVLEHPVVEKVLEYRTLTKLNSTYVEGLIPFINKKDGRIHSNFHQTVTATGRISSTEPNLQNIPTRIEIGKKLRKIFKPENKKIFIDADYSQIELRVLAHMSEDINMLEAFRNNEDIHAQAASKVMGIPINEVTKEQRSKAKAVNFGIVYGISDYGLAGQIKVPRKKAKEYIEQYLEKYYGIKSFMDNIVEKTKELGYVTTLFGRRRNVPELSSNNYMVRQFGSRVAMNTPIQGTAADIMKIAMINVYKKLKEQNLSSKLLIQVHDELLIETNIEEIEKVKNILIDCMENATKLNVPLIADLSEGNSWYEAK